MTDLFLNAFINLKCIINYLFIYYLYMYYFNLFINLFLHDNFSTFYIQTTFAFKPSFNQKFTSFIFYCMFYC